VYRDGVQSLRQLVTECKEVFMLKLGADPPANVKPLVINLRDGAEPVRMSARTHASLDWTTGYDTSGADVEIKCACQRVYPR
jgi:hypothetical protein